MVSSALALIQPSIDSNLTVTAFYFIPGCHELFSQMMKLLIGFIVAVYLYETS